MTGKSQRYMSIDFETASACDLKKAGAAVYAAHASTRVVCMAYSTPWDPKNPDRVLRTYYAPGSTMALPGAVEQWVKSGKPVRAWNALFEFNIWENHFAHIAPLELEQLHDTMAQAAYWGLPLSLDMAGQALPHLGIAKDKAGHRLMLQMSRPRGTEAGGSFRWWDVEDAQKRQQLLDYCEQDVRVEMAIGNDLPDLPGPERAVWLMDARMSQRGIPLDTELLGRMRLMAEQEGKRLNTALGAATAGAVTSTGQSVKLRDWAVAKGIPEAVDGLAKDKLPGLIELADARGLGDVRDALLIRQEAAKTSVAKLNAMENYAADIWPHRMCGLTQYYGAFRTGRWAGRGPQVQNFPRSSVKDQEGLVGYIKDPGSDADGIPLFFGVPPLEGLSSALRGCLWVPPMPGQGVFASIDFSQIEARVLAWLTQNRKVLNAYTDGKDLYVVAASGIYRVPEGDVDGDQRQVGKVSVLALGYGGGVGAFQTMAAAYGLEISDEKADEIKVAWRNDNTAVVDYWHSVEDAAKKAVKNPGATVTVQRGPAKVRFKVWNGSLICELPSGRTLAYRDVQIGPGKFTGTEAVTYMGVDQYTRKWVRLDTYGGKLVENITQAVARDIMAAAMLEIDGAYPSALLGSVHDEVLLQLSGKQDFDACEAIMRAAPPWAKGLPMDADGYMGRRFRK